MHSWKIFALGLAITTGTGCSGGGGGENPTTLVPVRGKVVGTNGQPVPWVEVTFYPTERGSTSAYGQAGSDGVFSVKCLDKKDGMVPGKYKVTVEPWKTKGSVPPKLDGKLAEGATTTLTADISGPVNDLTITLPK